MLIPVFTIYATQLKGANYSLIGLALGSYGLSQGLLQIPFGMLSDRFGRKPIITIGLILFACGSLLGALTQSISGMIIARILQGTGAIGSVLIALVADLTTIADRTKAMAIIGITIGLSFNLSLIISPIITHSFGLSGIFYLTFVLALFGLIILYTMVPTPQNPTTHTAISKRSNFKDVLYDKQLMSLNMGIFCQHAILTATFYVLPRLLQQQIAIGRLTESWYFYLPIMLLTFIIMLPLITIAEKKHRAHQLFIACIITTLATEFILSFTNTSWMFICVLVFAYFIAFNILEASLPSLISKQATADRKGTAMGIYSSCQFLGMFAGGALAGLVYAHVNSAGVFILNAAIACLWLAVSLRNAVNCRPYDTNAT